MMTQTRRSAVAIRSGRPSVADADATGATSHNGTKRDPVGNGASAARGVVDCDMLLEGMQAAHARLTRLLEIAGAKLAALRSADANGLHALASEEAEIIDELNGSSASEGRTPRSDSSQPAVLAGLAQQLRTLAPDGGRLTEIANGQPEPLRSCLLARTAGLREIALRLEEKNRLVASVARGLQDALHATLSDVQQARRERVGYEASGRTASRAMDGWIDAIG